MKNLLSCTPRSRPAFRPKSGALLASALLLALQAHAQSLDSASSACRSQPALCARVAGEEIVIPQAAQRLAEFGASVTAAAVVLNEKHQQAKLISPEKEEALLEEGCYSELRGTIKPDIVIHAGNPLLPLAVYDFKFPCENKDSVPWCKYKKGPHADRWQNEVYYEALGVEPKPILPWIGVMP